MFNIYKMLFLALKKVQMVKITLHQIPTTQTNFKKVIFQIKQFFIFEKFLWNSF